MLENALDLATGLAEMVLPEVALPLNVINKTVQTYKDYADKVLLSKLYKVLNNQDSDFDKWLKQSEMFDKSDKNYKKTVRKLVYTINAINEEELLEVYSNLLRSYKMGLICKQRFFKLTWVLSNIYSVDLFELKNIYKEKNINETQEYITLRNVNLLDSNIITASGGSSTMYSINSLGLDMLQYGIDLEHADTYKKYRQKFTTL